MHGGRHDNVSPTDVSLNEESRMFHVGRCVPWTIQYVPWTMHPLDDASPGGCVTWTMRPLDDASLGWCVPWLMRPLSDASLGRCVPWTICPLDDMSFGLCVPWTMRPLEDASLGRPAWPISPNPGSYRGTCQANWPDTIYILVWHMHSKSRDKKK
jgi:hypothetical protein